MSDATNNRFYREKTMTTDQKIAQLLDLFRADPCVSVVNVVREIRGLLADSEYTPQELASDILGSLALEAARAHHTSSKFTDDKHEAEIIAETAMQMYAGFRFLWKRGHLRTKPEQVRQEVVDRLPIEEYAAKLPVDYSKPGYHKRTCEVLRQFAAAMQQKGATS